MHEVSHPDEHRSELPIACTLGPGDAAATMGRWQQLAASAQESVHRDGHRVIVRYRAEPAIREELHLLAQAERECCAFAEWNLTELDDHVDLVVSARSGQVDDIEPLAEMFRAG